jgi:DEAD/DEAH box helicase
MLIQSKVKQYTVEELDLGLISDMAYEKLGKRPFQWQLEAAAAILCGKDVVLDVGTGSGKTLCFSLPLLLNERDVSLTISPLTALMIDQVNHDICLSHKLFSNPYKLRRPTVQPSQQQLFARKHYLLQVLTSFTR